MGKNVSIFCRTKFCRRFLSSPGYQKTLVYANMSKAHPPELKKYMDKQICLKLNGGRQVEGTLRGFDPFMNLVVDATVEVKKTSERNSIGMVVVRGTSVVMLEAMERICPRVKSHSRRCIFKSVRRVCQECVPNV